MKILAKKADRLYGRDAPNSVCVECDCGEHFLHECGRGDRATCPTCKHSATLDIAGQPRTVFTRAEQKGAGLG